jgi:hypothetical protein
MTSPSTGTTTESPAAGTAAEGDVVVSAVEYQFVGVPESVPAGTTFGLRNDGQEVHEFAVVRRNEGTDQPVEELLGMGDEAFGFVTFVGTIFAEPGQVAQGTVTVEEPGEYIAVCFIPVGTTSIADLTGGSPAPDAAGSEGGTAAGASPAAATAGGTAAGASPAAGTDQGTAASPGPGTDTGSPAPGTPHAALGMVVEFSVDGEAGPTTDASPAAGTDTSASPAAGAGTSPAPTDATG